MLILSVPVISATGISLTYDPNGNLVSGDGFYRVYNSLNQLWKVYDGNDTTILLEEYKYHPVEERVWEKKEYNNGSLIETTYYINQNTVKVVNSSGMFNYTYVYSNGQLVAESLNGVKTFTHTDNKGSVAVTTNSTGQVIEETFYDPFGAVLSGGTSTRYGYESKEHTVSSIDAVGYWSLDDNNLTTGGYTFYNGVAFGASQNSFGKYGGSYYFDGVNDYINISKNVLQSSNFTVMFWSYTPSANNNTGYIFCDANAASNLFFRRYDNGLTWNGQIDGVNMGSTTTNIPRDEWVHTAVVLNGTTAYVYVNGIKMNMTGTTTGITFTGLTTSLFLGNRQVLDRDYEGYLDNFQTYSRAMSQSEIQSIYNSEHPLTGNKLVSSFEFENAVNDSNNLISGQFDGAYRFEHQYVDIPEYNALDVSNAITISAWVYPTSGAQGYVVSKWRSYILQFTGSTYGNTMQGAIYSGGSFTPLATSATIPLNTWSHVVFTYNKTISKIYINGELSGTQTYTGSIDTTNNNLTIGGRNSTDRTRDFNGTVDEVNVFNKAINDDEVAELYSTGEITSKEYKDFNFRTYNPQLGIFTQPDTIIQNVYDPQSLNRYAFERNNPYKYIDDDGHILIVAAMGIGAAIGGTIGFAGYYLTHYFTDKNYNFNTALAYAAGGAVAGALAPVGGAIFGYGASSTAIAGAAATNAVGGAASQVTINALTDQPLSNNMGTSAIIGGALGAAGQATLPMARIWLIENPSSYFTTPTGQTFMSNMFYVSSANAGFSSAFSSNINQADISSSSSSNHHSSRSSGGGGYSGNENIFNNPITKPSAEYCASHSNYRC